MKPSPHAAAFLTPKSAQTFEHVLNVALQIFQKKGYQRTTMRDISRESDLGLGALYYYFRSKEEIVLHFYQRINQQAIEDYRRQSASPKGIAQAFANFSRLKLGHLEPHRDMLRVIMKGAVDPESILSPFHPASAKTLALSVGFFQDLVEQNQAARKEDAYEMAQTLWLAHLALLAYWLHDRSNGYSATYRLLASLSSLITWLGRASKIPGFGGLRKDLRGHICSLFPDAKPFERTLAESKEQERNQTLTQRKLTSKTAPIPKQKEL